MEHVKQCRPRLPGVLILLLAGCGPARPVEPGLPEPPAPEAPAVAPIDEASYVVLVSLDGTHPSFIDRAETPNLDRLAGAGVKADALIPAYPSKTFPNHYTLATGLRPARHGLVDNAFYDPAFDALYRLGDRDAVEHGRWYGGEPIWLTAERQGIRTASFFWVGTEAPVQGRHPSYFKYYDHDFPFAARVDTVLHWLSLPGPERPGLVLLYFHEPDQTAHRQGPSAPAVDSVMEALDGVMGRLLDGLDRLAIREQVHVLVVSDHGMALAPASNVIVLEDLVDLEGVRVIHNATQALLYFDGNEDRQWEVYEALQERLTHATAYLRDETPAHWHYRHNPRIGDLVVAADLGWIIGWPGDRWSGGGMHGWDPRHPEMHGIFLGAGPRLRTGARLRLLENIHVHPLVARLLGIEPAEGIDGRVDAVEPLLSGVSASP